MNKNQKTKQQIPKTRNQKGITLVALVITIIVLLILAVVAIRSIQNDSIIDYAKNSVDEYERAGANEQTLLGGYIDKIENYINGGPVTNPYDPDGWTYAWVCDDGIWGEMLNAGEKAEGDIVAKFYKTGNKITPQFSNLNEGDSYHLVIEGKGKMAGLGGETEEQAAYGWQSQTIAYLMGDSNEPGIICYVTDLTICDGISNVCDIALFFGISLTNATIADSVTSIGESSFYGCGFKNITIPNGVTSIGARAFNECLDLTSITIPNGVTSIGARAFNECLDLTSITIPSGVTSIGERAFSECYNLSKVKLLTQNDDSLIVGSSVFQEMPENSYIYVLSEAVKSKLEGTYDSTTKVEVVTEARMSEL